MKRKELTKIFMMISNCKKPFGIHGLFTNISALYGPRILGTRAEETGLNVGSEG